VSALVARGLPEAEALRRLWFIDGRGLVVSSRENLAAHKQPYAHDSPPMSFHEALEALEPDVLIGAAGQAGTFTEDVVRAMARMNERPVIFALSNPTSNAECTAAQAWRWSDGRVIFASGSPFPSMDLGRGRIWRPGQGNNAYVFPGVGLGAVACECTAVTDGMFLAAAEALAAQVADEDLEEGAVYPSLTAIRDVSLAIATAVAETAYAEGVARLPRPASLREHLSARMFDPRY